MSAAQIAFDIGIGVRGASRIKEAARANGIKLRGKPGRRPMRSRTIEIKIGAEYTPMLERLAAKHRLTPIDTARALIAAVFDQGETFVDNMLDLGGAGD